MQYEGRGHPDANGHTTDDTTGSPDDDPRARAEQWQLRLQTLLGTPATTGNEIRVLRNGVEIFPAMLDAIDAAERTVDLVTFVYWRGTSHDASPTRCPPLHDGAVGFGSCSTPSALANWTQDSSTR
jgi:hypothetical protein